MNENQPNETLKAYHTPKMEVYGELVERTQMAIMDPYGFDGMAGYASV